MTEVNPHNRGSGWQELGVLCVVAVMVLPLFTPRVYASDEIKYFATLRSLYFDRDLHYENEYAYFVNRDPVAHSGMRTFMEEPTPTGYRLNDAPIGTSLLWAPFYVAADAAVVVSRALGATVPRDGYAWPYVWAVCVGSLSWGMMGLLLVYRLCREFASQRATVLGVTGIWLASPIVFYLYITPAMSHASSFFTVALFLLVWHRGRRRREAKGWMVLGLVAGLMVLVRELNWLFLFVPVVDEVLSAGRTRVLVARWRCYVSFAVALLFAVAPQFYVYRILNGSFGPTPFVVEKFSIFPVNAVEVLFSGFHGLFSWHPVTLLGVVGLAVLWRRDRKIAGLLASVFVLQVLVVGAYDSWWGGASFGARRFINCSPIFALGLVAGVDTLRGWVLRVAGIGLFSLVIWNFGLAMQYSIGLIPRDAPVSMRQIARNQFIEVPPRISEITSRFIFDRSSLYQTKP